MVSHNYLQRVEDSTDDVENDNKDKGWRIMLQKIEETNAIYDTRITAMETQIENLDKFQRYHHKKMLKFFEASNIDVPSPTPSPPGSPYH
ncbi:unnamed protein product [Dovyalis caffra]|uniref:Uncharacterized protein n=1 Tax=Dovyalis caffra TaxID=77055 RepID=A0AAV1RM73_9ROSI|nr:unnamed protein product [Dovyalis caffra]